MDLHRIKDEIKEEITTIRQLQKITTTTRQQIQEIKQKM